MIEKHKIRPGLLLVKPSEPPKEQTTKSGIVIPVTAAKEPNNGRIVILGRPLPSDPHSMKVGDVVWYGERAVKLNSNTFFETDARNAIQR